MAESPVVEGNEAECVENLVRSHIIENWESQDEPEHLKKIRDRLLRCGEKRTGRLLGLYQQILEGDPPQPPLERGEQGSSEPPFLRGAGGISVQTGIIC